MNDGQHEDRINFMKTTACSSTIKLKRFQQFFVFLGSSQMPVRHLLEEFSSNSEPSNLVEALLKFCDEAEMVVSSLRICEFLTFEDDVVSEC